MKTNWQLDLPFDAIVFDCDGTLSSIEGIDELAEYNNVGPVVEKMTQEAMTDGKLTIAIYERRLNLVQPTKKQLDNVAQAYIDHITPDAQETIRTLQKAGKEVYIVSAGLLPPVKKLGDFLGVKPENIFAVDITLDHQTGTYQDFDRECSLTSSHGKVEIMVELKKRYKRIALIGDGMNDFLAAHKIDCFIGFGGHFYREKIAHKSDFYIKTCSLLPVLALCLSEAEIAHLSSDIKDAHTQAKQHIENQGVLINV